MHRLTFPRMRPRECRQLDTKLRTSTLPVRLYQRYRIVAEARVGTPDPRLPIEWGAPWTRSTCG